MTHTYEACGCGGTVVVSPARPGTEAKREHLDANGQSAICPAAR
ncbi:hypothetical protein GCM10010330_16220 [Streptomyces tendae]|nr:hypothetical protein [Streptomyces tendae]GHA64160.1 hypothetical protein GCM10010330_16220 [Streptomyces tendae]